MDDYQTKRRIARQSIEVLMCQTEQRDSKGNRELLERTKKNYKDFKGWGSTKQNREVLERNKKY